MWSRRESLIAGASAAILPALLKAAPVVEPGVPPADRELRVPVKGGSIYVRVNGNLAGPKPPIMMVHGGPGGALFQFFPALPLASERAVILYDQLDSGRSDAPNDKANWTVERYVSEIDAIRVALGVRHLHLLGHSWGGILATRYAAARRKGLQSLILQGTPPSDARLKASVEQRYAELPDNMGAVLLQHGRDATVKGPEYDKAHVAFMGKYLVGKDGRKGLQSAAMPYVSRLPEDRGDALAEYMIGNRIDGFGGLLKGFDDEPLLRKINVPTLVMFGEYDLMTRAAEEATVRKLRHGSLFEVKGAGHMAQFDQPEAWRVAISQFVSAHDSFSSRG